MLKFELILTFIFFIQKILNKECVIKNCESCQIIQEDKNGNADVKHVSGKNLIIIVHLQTAIIA